MAAISDLSDLVNILTGANKELLPVFKDNRVGAAAAANWVVGRHSSLWQYNGSPSHGAAPGAARIPTNSTAGTLQQANPGGGRQKYLVGFEGSVSTAGMLVLYDRIFDISGLSGTSTGAQTIQSGGSPALTRYTDGKGVQAFVEVYTQIGASATTITMSYTDQDGNTGQTSQAASIGGTGLREAQRMIPIPLASGDSGIQGVASVTLAATTGTAGDFGLTLARPLLYIGAPSFTGGETRDAISGLPALPEVLTNAGLAWMVLAADTSPGVVHGQLVMAEK